ncbi:MAG: hypothetical protein ACRD3W_29660 [Terriglobales bacterium]
MKKSFAFAASILMAVGTVLPALAEDGGLDKAVDGSLIVNRIGGVGAGLVIGAPISVTRHIAKSYVSITKTVADKVGGHEFGPSCLLASFVSIPAALVVGTAKGLYGGTKTGVTKGFAEPFNPETFSTGKSEE